MPEWAFIDLEGLSRKLLYKHLVCFFLVLNVVADKMLFLCFFTSYFFVKDMKKEKIYRKMRLHTCRKNWPALLTFSFAFLVQPLLLCMTWNYWSWESLLLFCLVVATLFSLFFFFFNKSIITSVPKDTLLSLFRSKVYRNFKTSTMMLTTGLYKPSNYSNTVGDSFSCKAYEFSGDKWLWN